MPDGPRGISIMRIFASRARAEIERLRAAAALRESEERLARILDSAMDAIVTFDATRRIELFNDAAEKVFRCPATEAIGRPLDRFLTDGFAAALDRSLQRSSAASGPVHLGARRSGGGARTDESFPSKRRSRTSKSVGASCTR